MKKIPVFPFIISLLLFFSCSVGNPDDSDVLAEVNDYKLTKREFQAQLADELEMDSDFKLTREARDEFLEEIIRKEILIQEAKNLNLDKEEQFIRSIERYWEATLIKDLMERKGKEISKLIVVSQEEIIDRYNLMKESEDDLPPLEDMEASIKHDLKEMKKAKKLKEWIDNLRKNAFVRINKKILYED
jgi:hypothetical protein